MSRLLKLYPRTWRQRYEQEVLAVIEQRPLSLADRIDLLLGAISSWSRAALPARRPTRGGRMRLRLFTQAAVAVVVAIVALLAGDGAPLQSPGAIRAAPGYNPAWEIFQTDRVYRLTVDNIGKPAIPHLLVELRSRQRWKALSVRTSPHHAVRTVTRSPFGSTWDFGTVGRWDILRIQVQYTGTSGRSRPVFLSLHAYGAITRTGQPDPAALFFQLPCTAIFVEGPPARAGEGPSMTRVTRPGCMG